jgi:hypothetical protein
MKNTWEALRELSNTIKEIINAYHDKKHDDVLSSCYFGFIHPDTYERDEILQKYASEARNCALNIFEQNPKLPEPPTPVSDPLVELQQIRQWCIRAEAQTSAETKDINKPQVKDGHGNDKPTPKNDSALIYQADAEDFYNIPKSMLSKASKKTPGEPGYLWSDTEGRRRFYRKKDLEKISRSRQKLQGN